MFFVQDFPFSKLVEAQVLMDKCSRGAFKPSPTPLNPGWADGQINVEKPRGFGDTANSYLKSSVLKDLLMPLQSWNKLNT